MHTPRLSLRHCKLSDAPFLLELMNTPGWLKYIGDRGIHSESDARLYLQEMILPAYETKFTGSWLVAEKTTGNPMGVVGVYQRPTLSLPDFGFAFLPEYHNRGYATEAGRALLQHVRAAGLNDVLAICLPTNTASIHLLQKLGFERNDMSYKDEAGNKLIVWCNQAEK